jgi:hypothetical protein
MRQITNLATPSQNEPTLRNLVELFPSASPLRIPILVSLTPGKGQSLEESTVIEFGTSMMVFFESRLPLELGDRLHLKNSDGSLGTEAIIVAMRVNDNRRAIAARFVAEVRNWIIQS